MSRLDRNTQDRAMMHLALRLAKRGLGTTSPNPSVGALVVDEATGEVIARGWTQPGGRPHAETEALARAGDRAAGATMYVTLEPCAHTGRSPTCSESVIASGIRRLVCASADPDPRISGRGFAMLRDAGVEVVADVLESEAAWIAAGHILGNSGFDRPFVQAKIAVSADGRIAPGRGQPLWVTGEEARAAGHLLRARTDAIVVGRGTVDADDPDLTCRLPGMAGRSPVRVVLDSRLSIALQSRLVTTARQTPVWVVAGAPAPAERARMLREHGVEVREVEAKAGGGAKIAAVLAMLRGSGIRRILLEGGPGLWSAFLDAGAIDEVVVFRGADRADAGGLLPFGTRGLDVLEDARAWTVHKQTGIGSDSVSVYRNTATTALVARVGARDA
ncbi:MAG: bifunctional diaminohydroxyphosphoribosylaminopyrimidine deaminase/5-amino-6-(5-phosphoribosylamino)uracil reductase RibD [Hyphomicrobiaceae bacterium]